MKIFLNLLVTLCLFSSALFAQDKPTVTMVMEGFYQGKNIFIKNSYGPGGIGYCITAVRMNGNLTTDEINADIFQIDLAHLNVKTGEKVKIEITYLKGCTPGTPLLLNPGALLSLNSNDQNKETSFVIEGTFRWQNLFVSCPLLPDGKGSGIKQVLINDTPVNTNTNKDVFEIDLIELGMMEGDKKIKDGDKIKIELRYLKGYDPLLINPEAVR